MTLDFTKKVEIYVIEEAQLCSETFLQKLNDFLSSETDRKRSDHWGLILSCSELSCQPTWQALFQRATTLNLCAEKPWEMRSRWQDEMISIARQRGVKLTQSAAALIVERSGNSRFFAQTELERLLLFTGEKGVIDNRLCAHLVGHQQDGGLWPLVRAVEQKDIACVWSAIISLPPSSGGLGAIALMRAHFQALMVCLEKPHEYNAKSKERWQQRREQQKNQNARSLGKSYLMRVLHSLHFADEVQRTGEIASEDLLQSWFFEWIRPND